jgi:hypothetical protein
VKRVVPFVRELRPGTRGKDVVAVKRALWRAGVYRKPRAFTRIYGPFVVRAVKRFQRQEGLIVDGQYGLLTHRRLARWFDEYAVALLGQAPRPTHADEIRARILSSAAVLYNRRSHVHYTMGWARMQIVRQRMDARDLATVAHIYEDCSSSITGLYFVAGGPDPNHLDFNGQGFTGTMCAHGRSVPLVAAKPCAAVFYGNGPPWKHVALYLGGGRVWSFGSEAGPYILPIDYRGDRGDIREYLS